MPDPPRTKRYARAKLAFVQEVSRGRGGTSQGSLAHWEFEMDNLLPQIAPINLSFAFQAMSVPAMPAMHATICPVRVTWFASDLH
jgi:hypothetical protein